MSSGLSESENSANEISLVNAMCLNCGSDVNVTFFPAVFDWHNPLFI